MSSDVRADGPAFKPIDAVLTALRDPLAEPPSPHSETQ